MEIERINGRVYVIIDHQIASVTMESQYSPMSQKNEDDLHQILNQVYIIAKEFSLKIMTPSLI